MKQRSNFSILGGLVFAFTVLIALGVDTIVFNSIVFSHYGGFSAVYSPYVLSLILSFSLGTALFMPSLLSFLHSRQWLLRLLFILVFACISCFIFIGVAWRLQVGPYGRYLSEIFEHHLYYIFAGAFAIQLFFLAFFKASPAPKFSRFHAFLRVLLFQTTVVLTASLLNAGSIYESYQRRASQPNYMKGNYRIFRVVLGEKCGTLLPKIDGTYTIEFPENGLVILQNEEAAMHQGECRYFFTNSDQQQQELHIFDYWDDEKAYADAYERKHGVKGMTFSSTRNIAAPERDGMYSSVEPGTVTYWNFTVRSESFSYYNNRDQPIHALTDSLLVQCRKGR